MKSVITKLKCRWWLFSAKKKFERKHYAEALALIQKVLTVQFGPAQTLVRAGSCLRGLKRYNEAINCYERALQIVPNYGEAHAFLSLSLSDLGHYQQALESMNRAFRIKPTLAKNEFWIQQRGFLLGKLGQLEESLAAYKSLTQLNQQHADGWHGVGWANTMLNRHSEAVTAYERASKLKPKDPVVQADLGAAYLNLGRAKEGL
jgi:tetratricopeptide (TPR) repeat protein